MKRFFPLAIVLVACSTGTDSKNDTDADTDVTAETGDTTAQDTDQPTSCVADAPATGSILYGTVVDADSHGLGPSSARIQFCRSTTCVTAPCRGPGVWGFDAVDAGWGSFEAKPLDSDTDFATVFLPLNLEEGAARQFSVELPRLSPSVALPASPAALEVTPGLFVTLGTGGLIPPALEEVVTAVSAVDGVDAAPPIDNLTGTVVAVYFFAPFNHTAADETDTAPDPTHGIPYELVDDWGLGVGGGEVWMGDYATSSWVKIGDVIAGSADGRLTTTNRLPKLSTLVVVRKPSM